MPHLVGVPLDEPEVRLVAEAATHLEIPQHAPALAQRDMRHVLRREYQEETAESLKNVGAIGWLQKVRG
jgi:hypothetical protein